MHAQSPDRLRLFFALWPDASTRTALTALQQPLQGRKVPYENLHITLAFLGEQDANLLPTLKEVLARLPATPMTLTLDRLGYFSRNKIAWAGMHAVPAGLLSFQAALAQALTQEGIAFDQKEFRPHVTLARDAAAPGEAIFTPITWQANDIALVQSATQVRGAAYQVLATRSLQETVRIADDNGTLN